MFDFATSLLPVSDELAASFRHVWNKLAQPGTWWTGAQRVAIAAVARDTYDGNPSAPQAELPSAAVAAAALLSATPAKVTPELIAQWEDEGLDPHQYVELIGIISRVTVVDTFHRAMELPLEPLPQPEPGEPSRIVPDPPPTLTKAWMPMVGPPTIPTSLSAVPAEMEAQEALHGPAYLAYEEMSDPAIVKGLSRAQMELVASRTSVINECFF